MRKESEIREYAARYGFTIRKLPNHGGVKLTDIAGNERIYTDIQSADEIMRTYRDEPLTSYIYEVGEKGLKSRSRIAAKNGEAAKRKYRSITKMVDPSAVLEAKKRGM
ncbi:hypothetical protein L1N85_19535 [Paenibacillus alkaliterrae]|uniref:hypothetical protein n=1 Tax=Paenibacillus alkaliterrae TaxID=320909 RepID=UPI001F23B156|nr:hypothetical protein [Paenibacillus alkaliterrae]MCF2940589.1 hypothetical protein [Paenibacillus alkaliterrae]